MAPQGDLQTLFHGSSPTDVVCMVVRAGSSVGDTLTGLNAASTWNITNNNAGSYVSTNTLTFSSIENLTGGSNTDAFVFTDGKDDSGSYWVVDIVKGSADIIGQAYPTVGPESVGPVRWVDYKAADGLTIHPRVIVPAEPDRKLSAFDEQAHQVITNVLEILEASGSAPDLVLKATVYIADIAHWPAFNSIYAERLGRHKPARTVVPVTGLHYGYLVEMDVIAAVRGS